MNATVACPIVESVFELSAFMKIICLKHRRYEGTIIIMQIPFTNGMHEAVVAIKRPISGMLNSQITAIMQNVIGTPMTKNGIADSINRILDNWDCASFVWALMID